MYDQISLNLEYVLKLGEELAVVMDLYEYREDNNTNQIQTRILTLLCCSTKWVINPQKPNQTHPNKNSASKITHRTNMLLERVLLDI